MPTGCTLSLMLGGVIAEAAGWEYVFYAFGAAGLAWSALWCLFMHDSPHNNPRHEHNVFEMVFMMNTTVICSKLRGHT